MSPIKAHLLDRLRPQVQPMTESEYLPLALRTWTAPLRGTHEGVAYLQLGLLSEIGECYGVLKRILRDKTPMDVAQDRFEDELGDVLWYESVLRWEMAQKSFDAGANNISAADHDFDHAVYIMCCTATDLGIDAGNDAHARARARNIAKLASRAERGVIQGSGGDR